jgi:hypothetical protein
MPWSPPQLYTEVWKKMTMVITLFLVGLEGQTPSSLEDDGICHGRLHNSSLRKHDRLNRRKMAMVILLSLLGLEGQTSSSLEDMT